MGILKWLKLLKVRLFFQFTLLAFSLGASEILGEEVLKVFFTANRLGEVDPCGCQEGQIGGLNRLKAYLDIRRGSPDWRESLYLDSGDSFFASKTVNPFRSFEELERAKLIAHGMRRMGLDVFSPGERDFAGGIEFLRELKRLSRASFVATNLTVIGDERPLLDKTVILEKQGMKIGILSAADPELFKEVSGIEVSSAEDAIEEYSQKLKDQGASVIILLSHLGLKADQKMAEKNSLDIIIGSHSLDSIILSGASGRAFIGQTKNEGQQVGEIQFLRGDPAKSKSQLVSLDEAFDSKNDVSKLMEETKEKVRQLALTASQGSKVHAKSKQLPAYVAQAYQCATCHKAQYDFWENTKHASAYLVLFSKNQHFNPECIACHSLGFEEPAGFQKIAQPIEISPLPKDVSGPLIEYYMKEIFGSEISRGALDSRKEPERYSKLKKAYHETFQQLNEKKQLKKLYIGVQCEHCHGNRQDHPSVKQNKTPVKESTCKNCHSPPNDNHFNFTEMKPKVACPKMGT